MSRAEDSVKESLEDILLEDRLAGNDEAHQAARIKFRRTKAMYGDSRAMEGRQIAPFPMSQGFYGVESYPGVEPLKGLLLKHQAP